MEKPTELIIPLIRKNRWYKDDARPNDKEDSKNNAAEQEEDSVESQAVKELIEGMLNFRVWSGVSTPTSCCLQTGSVLFGASWVPFLRVLLVSIPRSFSHLKHN